MIALRRAILMKANPVVSLHAHRLFSGRACSCKKDPCSPQENWTLFHYVKMTFLLSRKPPFLIQSIIKRYVWIFFRENETEKNFSIFVENHGLTPQENWTLSPFVKTTFWWSRKPFFPFRTLFNIMSKYFSKKMTKFVVQKTLFLFRTLLNTMSRSFSKKMRLRINFKFLTKIMG